MQFGPDVTQAFLKRNKLELIVRSHEVKAQGYEVAHGGKLITVFSAPNYCDQMGNKVKKKFRPGIQHKNVPLKKDKIS